MTGKWATLTLGDVLKRSDDTIVPDAEAEYREITVRLWGKGVVLRGLVPGARLAGQRRYVARRGQFILSRIDARNGALGIVPPELDGALVSNDFPVFRIAEDNLYPAYLAWLCKTVPFVEECRRASEGTTNRVRLQEQKFLARTIPLPPHGEQVRVVARINALSAQIGEAQMLRKSASKEAETLSRSTIETVYKELASKFGISRLAEACATITDGDHNTPPFGETGIRFIFVGNVSSGLLHFRDCKRVSDEYFKTLRPQRLPHRGDLLYSAVGATLGIPAVVDSDEPFCFQRHIAILKPNPKRLDSRFGWYMLRSRTVFDKAWSATTGSAQPTIPLRAIRELPIPLPPLAEQRRIISDLDCLQAEVNRLRSLQAETTTELDALLPSVLSRAFAGEL
jgi:type I restriction enzyme S subunit